MTGTARMATPEVLLSQSLKGITCSECALHMKGALVVLADKRFFYLVSVMEHAGHFGMLYKSGIRFVVVSGV